jgi:hypothetical protein
LTGQTTEAKAYGKATGQIRNKTIEFKEICYIISYSIMETEQPVKYEMEFADLYSQGISTYLSS